MSDSSSVKNVFDYKKELCKFCGSLLLNNGLCRNPNCISHQFVIGNRVRLLKYPDYGFGFIKKIIDFKSPYEYCVDSEDEEVKNVEERASAGINGDARGGNPKDNSLFFERPIYQVAMKLYFDKIVSAEDLVHDIFEIDTEVITKFGRGTIKKVNINSKSPKVTYIVQLEDNTERLLNENEIIEYYNDPIEAFNKGALSAPELFMLNTFGNIFYDMYSSTHMKFITNARLRMMPHQIYVVHRLLDEVMPRMILADEVGLGKTIESGMFIKEMISRNLASKVLIIVPANLVSQWIFEMSNKFSIEFTRFDSEFISKLDRCNYPNVFFRTDTQKEYPFVICSMQTARISKYRDILSELYWDIVVFDEAHHLRRYITGTGSYRETNSYTAAKMICRKARSVLLLTATPIQLHSFDLFSLLELIRPDIFHNYEDFETERKKIPLLNNLIKGLHDFHNLNHFQQKSAVDQIHDFLSNPPLIKRRIAEYYDAIIGETIREESASGKVSAILSFDDVDDSSDQNGAYKNKDENTTDSKNSRNGGTKNTKNTSKARDKALLDQILYEELEKKYPSKINMEDKLKIKSLIEENFINKKELKTYSYERIEKLIRTSEGREFLIRKLIDYHFLGDFIIRNRKKRVFAKSNKRIVKDIEVKLTKEEFEVYNEIRVYLARTYNKALETNNNAIGFVMTILQKLLTSSPPALIYSLEKRVQSLQNLIDLNTNKLSLEDGELYNHETLSFDDDDWDAVDEDALFAIDRIATLEKELKLNKNNLEILTSFIEKLKALKTDSKLNTLLGLVSKIMRSNKIKGSKKVIIFTQFKRTLFYIKKSLVSMGFKVEEFHGDMNRKQKNSAVERFREDSQILLSTEVGGEGRNFQFCNIMINYDMPWNPMRLEQRIGRIDRIGQEHDVYIFNFKTLGTIETKIFDMLKKRIQLFEESIGNLAPILADLEKSINKTIFNVESKGYMNSLYEFEKELIRKENKIDDVMAQLHDFILDIKSFEPEKVDDILKNPYIVLYRDIEAFFKYLFGDNRQNSLKRLMQSDKNLKDNKHVNTPIRNPILSSFYADPYLMGSIHEKHNEKSIPYYEISLDKNTKNILRLEHADYSGVFDLELAQVLEELDFFSIGHPLVTSISNYFKNEKISNPATILKLDIEKALSKFGKVLPPAEKMILTRLMQNKDNQNLQTSLESKTSEERLYLMGIYLEYMGVFLEKRTFLVAITNRGVILPKFSELISKAHNFLAILPDDILDSPYALDFNTKKDSLDNPDTSYLTNILVLIKHDNLKKLSKIALKYINKKVGTLKQDLINYNQNMFKKELQRILNLHEFKRKYILRKIYSYKKQLQILDRKKLTKRKKINLEKIEDPIKKAEKEQYYKKIDNEIYYFTNQISKLEKELDDMEFNLPEDIKRLEFYRNLRKKIEISRIALIQ
ncbi:MAG: helicase-related protein [Promethearchaeota archaeon]